MSSDGDLLTTAAAIELIQAGNQIGAIKLYRELTGEELKEAKDAVDELSRTYRPGG